MNRRAPRQLRDALLDIARAHIDAECTAFGGLGFVEDVEGRVELVERAVERDDRAPMTAMFGSSAGWSARR